MDIINSKLETPLVVVDMQKAQSNIKAMQQVADDAGCKLRPHIKTHKTQLFAKCQIAAGACGITCAKLGEAEVMLSGGIDDIFIAYPIVDIPRMERAAAILPRCKRLILAVDSMEGAVRLNNFALGKKISFEVRIEADTGLRRTGQPFDHIVELAKAVAALPALCLTGIYTFKSLLYKGSATTDKQAAGIEEGEMMRQLRKQLAEAGLDNLEMSAGSTPTAIPLAQTGLVDEIRPGTYIFNDWMLVSTGVAKSEDVAAKVIATVVSTPQPDYAVLDGGCKCFSTDTALNQPPYFYPGYAVVEGNPDLIFDRLYEEHGMIRSVSGNTGLKVGQRLELIPLHVCPTINLHNELLIDWGGYQESIVVAARGMLV